VGDEFKHPDRKVGLGIPFLLQTARESGGGCDIKSAKDSGTRITAWFDRGNIDTPPTGDLPGLFRTILLFEEPKDIVIRRHREDERGVHSYVIRKSELSGALEDLSDATSLILLDQYLKSLEK
jgi:hypothetical protein